MPLPRSRDLQSSPAIILKGILFAVLGILAGTLLLLEFFSWPHLAFLLITIWAFCRAYYFAFYVIEKYVDGQFRYAGLWDFLRYLSRSRSKEENRKS